MTIGSALDIFGGNGVKLEDCVSWNRRQVEDERTSWSLGQLSPPWIWPMSGISWNYCCLIAPLGVTMIYKVGKLKVSHPLDPGAMLLFRTPSRNSDGAGFASIEWPRRPSLSTSSERHGRDSVWAWIIRSTYSGLALRVEELGSVNHAILIFNEIMAANAEIWWIFFLSNQ